MMNAVYVTEAVSLKALATAMETLLTALVHAADLLR